MIVNGLPCKCPAIQFSIRTMLCAVTALALLMGLVTRARTSLYNDWRSEQVCVAKLKRFGGDVHYKSIDRRLARLLLLQEADDRLQRVEWVTMPISGIGKATSPEVVALVKKLPSCKSVAVHGSFHELTSEKCDDLERLEALLRPVPICLAVH